MKLELSTNVVAGTDRGGENLLLVVRFSTLEEPTPEYLEANFDAAWDACVAALPTEEDEDLWVVDEDGAKDLWVVDEDGTPTLMSHLTNGYKFSVDWSVSYVRDQARRVAFGDEWVKRLKSGEYSVQEELFVDGNAE